ncbi:MAG: hypothetical protein ACT4PU_03860 [Planctomycetota bacterium]
MLTTLLSFPIALAAMTPLNWQSAPPAGGAASEQVAPAATAVTAPAVRTFLTEAQQRLYDPQTAGLREIGLELPLDVPGIGPIGLVAIQWAATTGPTVKVRLDSQLSLPPGVPKEMLEMQGQELGRQFLIHLLNRPIGSLLESGVAKMGTPEDALIPILIEDPQAVAQGLKSQTHYFDEDGQLLKSRFARQTQGASVTELQAWTWSPVSAENPQLLLRSQSAALDMGMFKTTTTTTFEYRDVAGIQLLTGMNQRLELPAMMGGTQSMLLSAKSLVVNGQPVEATPTVPPTPAGS